MHQLLASSSVSDILALVHTTKAIKTFYMSTFIKWICLLAVVLSSSNPGFRRVWNQVIKQALYSRMTNDLVKFESFIRVPEIFYDMIGITRYGEPRHTTRARLKQLFFWSSYANTIFCLIIEHIYFIKAAGNFTNFLELTALAPCIGFTALSIVKIMTVKLNEAKLNRILDRLNDLFPTSHLDQERYRTFQYNLESQVVMKSFSILYMILIWIFNLLPLVSMLVNYLANAVLEKELPYFMWYWYDWNKEGYYELTFFHQIWGGFDSAVFNLCTDLMFCAIILLLCLQFDIIAYRLKNATNDYRELVSCIELHQAVVDLSDQLESIFSPSILVNFVGSSVIICLVGFQATSEISAFDLFKFILFLISSLVQVFLLCYYGNKLIEASSQIAYSAFEGNWYMADARYQKSLLFVVTRAGKWQKLTAMKFSVVSLASYSAILSTSFSYFTLLKTIYEPK
ncbi:odorant receptor 85c-like [Sabethes cyaneus]|uniref:odorant receptor 85c-like n=1 Tax=Sabethes cyaneus TaxID=53552 RepID=UPI00237D3FE8|nr:odorant receptor 85c-like [Sabethes cyaneus]